MWAAGPPAPPGPNFPALLAAGAVTPQDSLAAAGRPKVWAHFCKHPNSTPEGITLLVSFLPNARFSRCPVVRQTSVFFEQTEVQETHWRRDARQSSEGGVTCTFREGGEPPCFPPSSPPPPPPQERFPECP